MNTTLKDSAAKRWFVMLAVSFTMLTGYFVADVMAPLKSMLESQLQWNSEEYGLFTSAYGWFNVFLFMLLIGGIILDKMGVRFTGVMASSLMVFGAVIKYFAISSGIAEDVSLFGIDMEVLLASIGYAIFCVGLEIFGITASKVIVKWFKGKELALALGLQIAVARIGTTIALMLSVPVADAFGKDVAAPVMLGCIALLAGLVMYISYCVLDTRLDKQISDSEGQAAVEDVFKLSDIKVLVSNKMFWIICFLCLSFYAGVFPFLKYATDLMVQKFGVDPYYAGIIPGLVPFGTLLMTPIFGAVIDKKGKAATLMIFGSILLVAIHLMFAIPALDQNITSIILMLLMGIAFSLVPSAMWPTLARITPEKQLGSAYAVIFWLQNIGLMGVPYLIGWELNRFCTTVVDGVNSYDYTIPMLTFAGIAGIAVVLAVMLKIEDKRKGYGLEEPSIKQ